MLIYKYKMPTMWHYGKIKGAYKDAFYPFQGHIFKSLICGV